MHVKFVHDVLCMRVFVLSMSVSVCVSAGELTRQAASALTGPNSYHMPHGMGSACCFGQRVSGAP